MLSLGLNCEPMMQFERHFGWRDSHLLSWVAISDFKRFLRVLTNPDIIFSGDVVELLDRNNMWGCYESGMAFHGRHAAVELLNDRGERDQEKMDAEFTEVKSRVDHHVKSFKALCASGERILFLLSLNPVFCEKACSSRGVAKIFAALSKTVKNFALIAVTESDFLHGELQALAQKTPGLYAEKIDYFCPDNLVNVLVLSDQAGWSRIFNKFPAAETAAGKRIHRFTP